MDQRTKSTRPGLPHTGRSHGRVPLARRHLDRGRNRREQGIAQGKPIDPSQKLDSPSRLKISLIVDGP
ncbi:hypothetical protein F383_30002 [Gossypium arboreum]|uniref:Uncharacterized protein n=1 Tax=Gossypium arboreum TaxID=29729 RepID=A0A0B0MXQ0_GOSAR|nr:hypothetical protein F383_30002 [Gossypium arboreum]